MIDMPAYMGLDKNRRTTHAMAPANAVCHEKYLNLGRKFGAPVRRRIQQAMFTLAYTSKKNSEMRLATVSRLPMKIHAYAMNQAKRVARMGSSPNCVPYLNGDRKEKTLSLASACMMRPEPTRLPRADEIVLAKIPTATTYFENATSCMILRLSWSASRCTVAPMMMIKTAYVMTAKIRAFKVPDPMLLPGSSRSPDMLAPAAYGEAGQGGAR